MANADDEDELLAQLAERLKTIREDADLARSAGLQSISAALDRAEVRLHDLATSLEALCRRVEQQQVVVERVDATSARGEAETQALKQTVETLSFQVQQQAEMLRRLSVRKRWRRIALCSGLVAILLGGSIAGFLWSGHAAGFGPLPRRIVDWLSEFVAINSTWLGGPTMTRAESKSAPASDPQSVMGSSASVAFNPTQPSSARPEPPEQVPATTAPSPGSSLAVDVPAPPEAVAAAVPIAGSQPSSAGVTAAPPESLAPMATLPSTGSQNDPGGAILSESHPVTAPVPPDSPTSPVAQSIPAPPALVRSYPKPNGTRKLVLKATDDSWVRVRASDGSAVFSRTLRRGETQQIPIDAGFALETGNVAGLEVEVDGLPIALTGAKGGVARNVPLDAPLSGSASRP